MNGIAKRRFVNKNTAPNNVHNPWLSDIKV